MLPLSPPPLSPQSMADLLCTIILLCRGTDKKGKPFWAYMCVKPSMATAFQEAREQGSFNLEDFGTIIETGEGNDVPHEVQERMQRDYGVNHNYEDELLKAIDAIMQEDRI